MKQVLLQQLGKEGVATGVFPGFAVLVSEKRKGKWRRMIASGGATRVDALAQPVNDQTFFDLASLTKALCTTLCIIRLIGAGKLDWQSPWDNLFPCTPCVDKQSIQLRHLLSHSSGLAPYRQYYLTFSPRQDMTNGAQLVRKVMAEALIYPTGQQSQYSDLGFILLGSLVERLAQKPLHIFFEETITAPLGISKELLFFPLAKGLSCCPAPEKVAATEDCPWRQKIMQGQAHDEHCWLMGGVAGHAGLFGKIGAVARLCELLMDLWKERVLFPGLDADLIRYALETKTGPGTWRLGFDTPTRGSSSSGSLFSPHSVGHLGYTGVSFWMDPLKDRLVVLLTNRVHPTRLNTAIQRFRPMAHDKIMQLWS